MSAARTQAHAATRRARRYGGVSERTIWIDPERRTRDLAWQRELRESGIPLRSSDAPMAAGALTGVAAGATAGSVAGPPGALLGAVVGGALGAIAGHALEAHAREEDAIQRELDETIGVLGGDLGAADPNQPPPRFGAYSLASAGMGRSSHAPAEGPMPSPELGEGES